MGTPSSDWTKKHLSHVIKEQFKVGLRVPWNKGKKYKLTITKKKTKDTQLATSNIRDIKYYSSSRYIGGVKNAI
jgi:hypothetical protein